MRFRDDYWFLSNFYPSPVTCFGLTFDCAEAAFCACKCANPADRAKFVGLNGAEAKKLGRRVDLRSDWSSSRLDWMKKVLERKFADPVLREMLLATGEEELVEENDWNDRFWGVCRGNGLNMLGILLMEVRASLR
jgi:ribA/ribD-fused uncharacterized protein